MKMAELERVSGVSRETIRFYIREGLLPQPHRPHTNVAIYSERHVSNLERIRRLQKNPELTLGVIRRVMNVAGPVDDDFTKTDFDDTLARLIDPAKVESIEVETFLGENDRYEDVFRIFCEVGVCSVRMVDGDRHLAKLDADIIRTWVGGNADGSFIKSLGFSTEGIVTYVGLIDDMVDALMHNFVGKVSGRMERQAAAELAVKGLEGLARLLPLLFIHSIRKKGAVTLKQ